jgi:dihydroneopterin aldolase
MQNVIICLDLDKSSGIYQEPLRIKQCFKLHIKIKLQNSSGRSDQLKWFYSFLTLCEIVYQF